MTDGVCARCGNVGGDANRCPHCGSIARVEPKGHGASLHWVCGVCAGPRMPGGLGAEAAMTPLREAKASLGAATRSRAAFWVFAIMATFMTLIVLAAWPAAILAKLILLAMAVAPTLLAVRARARAGKANEAANEALDRAWLAAAEDVTSHAKKGVTVAELAGRLKIDAVKAEKLLTQLAVNERTRIDVDDDAEVRYSIASDAVAKVRVDSTEDKFRALEEAEAESLRAESVAGAARGTPEPGVRRMTVEEEADDPTRVPFPRGRAR